MSDEAVGVSFVCGVRLPLLFSACEGGECRQALLRMK